MIDKKIRKQLQRDNESRKKQMLPILKNEACRLVRSYQNLTGILLPVQITDDYNQVESFIKHMNLCLHNARVEMSLNGW